MIHPNRKPLESIVGFTTLFNCQEGIKYIIGPWYRTTRTLPPTFCNVPSPRRPGASCSGAKFWILWELKFCQFQCWICPAILWVFWHCLWRHCFWPTECNAFWFSGGLPNLFSAWRKLRKVSFWSLRLDPIQVSVSTGAGSLLPQNTCTIFSWHASKWCE